MVSDGKIESNSSYPHNIILVDQVQLTAEANSTHPTFRVRVLDLFGYPLPNARISLLTTSGTVSASSMTTNILGEVEISWNFGNEIGLQTLKIIADVNEYIFTKDIAVYLDQSTVSTIQSTITGETNILADGYSASLVTIVLKTASGIGIKGIIPTFSATDTGGKNVYSTCSESDAGGVSYCELRSTAAEDKLLEVVSPVSFEGDTVTFTDPNPLVAISFTTQPGATTTDNNFSPQPVIQTLNEYGQPIYLNSTSVIVLKAYSGTNCSGSEIVGGLGGSDSILLSNGTATFTDVRPLKTSIRSLLASTGSISKCSNNFTVAAGAPTQIAINSGNNQTDEVASILAPFEVLVTDANDNLVPSATVNWSITSGSGTLSANSSQTNSSGLASSTLTLGTALGISNVEATINGTTTSVSFTAEATPGQPASLTIDDGNNQTGTAGSPLPAELAVIVKDGYGNLVPNILINWSNILGTGLLSASSSTTDTNGVAKVNYTLGATAGLNQVTATVDNQAMLNVTLSATGVAGSATQIQIVSGDEQNSYISTDLTLVVKVMDANDNLIQGQTVYWSAPEGTFASSQTTTNSGAVDPGQSSNVFTLGNTAGAYTVTASLNLDGSTPNTTFNLTATDAVSSWMTQIGLSKGSNTFTTDASGDDICKKSTRDMAGTLYCAGSTTGSLGEMNGGGKDAIIAKFTPTGDLVWIRQLGAFSKDTSGNNSGNDECTSIILSNDGLSLYCGGHTTGSMSEPNGGGQDAFVAKINATSGELSWIVQLGQVRGAGFSKGESSGDDTCEGVAIDTTGIIYCGGGTRSTDDGNQDAFIVKINPAGTSQTIIQLGDTLINPNATATHNEDESCLSLASSGTEIFCGGATKGNLGNAVKTDTFYDVFTLSLNATTGTINWLSQIYSATGDDYCLSLYYESLTKQVLCGGSTNGDFFEVNGGASGTTDVILASFDNDPANVLSYGSSIWAKQLGATTRSGPPSLDPTSFQGNESCLSITSDSGRIYCGGETDGFVGEANIGGKDAFISLFSIGGNYITSKQLGATFLTTPGFGLGDESCTGLEIFNDGFDDFLTCIGATTGNIANANGGPSLTNDIFTVQFNLDTGTNSMDQINSIPAAPSTINKAALDDVCKSITQDNSGNIYCAGHTYGSLEGTNAGGADAFIMKLNKNGETQWIKQFGVETLSHLSTEHSINYDGSGNDFCTGLSLDSEGNIYCGGYTDGDLKEQNAGQNDIFITKLDSSGDIQWITHFGDITSFSGGDNSGDDKCHALAVRTKAVGGEAFCAGETSNTVQTSAGNSDAIVIKLDELGQPVWGYQKGSSDFDAFYAIKIDSSGYAYAAGKSNGEFVTSSKQGEYDVIMIKLNDDGVAGSIAWEKQAGDTGSEGCLSIALSTDENTVYCGGGTTSSWNGQLLGNQDAFVARTQTDGSSFLEAFQINQIKLDPINGNADGEESCNSIQLINDNGTDTLYCSGETTSAIESGVNNGGGTDAFIAKIDLVTEMLLAVYQLGSNVTNSNQNEYCYSLLVNDDGSMICGGSTLGSIDVDDVNGYGSDGHTSDILIFKLDNTGNL